MLFRGNFKYCSAAISQLSVNRKKGISKGNLLYVSYYNPPVCLLDWGKSHWQKVALAQRGYQIRDVLEISGLDWDAFLSIVSQVQLVDELFHLVMRE